MPMRAGTEPRVHIIRLVTLSFGNILLIATQKPNATHVAGIRSWNLLGRRVRRGEKGIMIFAPMLGRKRKESQQTDAKDADSQVSVSLVGLRPVYVWDVLQTEGKELPQLDSEVKGDVGSSLARLVNFTIQQGVKFGYSDNIAPARGMSYGGAIRILPNLSEAEQLSTLVHELAHLCGAEIYVASPRDAHKDGSITADQRHIIVE